MTPRHRADVATLYLRNVPAALVRKAKVKAAQAGTTLTAVVIDALERSLEEPAPTPVSADDDLRESMRWYEEHRTSLLRRYRDEFVAIVDHEVVDHDADFEILAKRVFGRLGVRQVFMPRVTSEHERVRVRSPRRRVS
jgi:hypothetical protein